MKAKIKRNIAQEIIYNSVSRADAKRNSEQKKIKVIRPIGIMSTYYEFEDGSGTYFERDGFGVTKRF